MPIEMQPRQPGENGPVTQTVAMLSGASSPASATPAPDGSRFVPGTILSDRYRIVALLGHGGMGEVYRADDLTLGQQVALKFLPVALTRNEDALRRFRNEVRIARQVSHPNVCRVYDVGEMEGHLFLSMEYVDGEDLGSLLRRIGRLPSDKALEVARKLCAGLAAAHEKGVLHRDLKPSNIMLDARGQVLLTDFGLSGLVGEIGGAEIFNGTPVYMAPEQLSGKEVSVRSDIYALGLVLYEIFTGKRAFEANTLQELIRARNESTPTSLTTLVRDLDPAIESVILRCLQADPSQRPSSALAVSAALPGGDPLAAALAAGETPSPQMVAAAGESLGIAPRFALPVFLAILAGIVINSAMAMRTSALDRIRPEFPPEVLQQKARDLITRVGYNPHPADSAQGFEWHLSMLGYFFHHGNRSPQWDQVLAASPSILRFWYRQSDYSLGSGSFHDDLLTPGVVDSDDPPPVLSGMVGLQLDSRGQLVDFQAVPPQREQPSSSAASPPVDWSPLFAAANLDPSHLTPTEPLWTWLATSDIRVAWTGTWPGSDRPLRVEAAALRGKPVAFALLGPWTHTDRMPPTGEINGGRDLQALFYALIAVVICFLAVFLARLNLVAGRGDRRGALRLAIFVFLLQMALWLTRGHFSVSIGLLGDFLLAVCTSSFYGIAMWTLYLAVEPLVRRYWPRTLISWTRVLSGQFRDPIVGRDALFGVVLGVSWILIGRISDLFQAGQGAAPTWTSVSLLLGARSTLGAWLECSPRAIRGSLIFFFLLFLFRVLLRNQWLGAAAFALVMTAVQVLGGHSLVPDIITNLALFGLVAIVVLRYGLLALSVGILMVGFLAPPPTLQTSAWYFGNVAFLTLSAVALASWAFYTSLGNRRSWKPDFLA